MNTIRCSMLPAWDDCSRRTGARQYTDMLATHGHTLKSLLPSVGAAIGTAMHKAAGHFLLARLAGGDEPTFDECAGLAEGSLAVALDRGAVWDATTPNFLDARKQIERMLRAYWPVLVKKRPLIVESELRATVGDAWELSGHVDCFDILGALDDLKTGAVQRGYIAQIGSYGLLLQACGHEAKKAGMTYVPRVRLSKPQPGPIYSEYDLKEARQVAWRTIQEITRTMDEFAATGNPHVIRANSMSMMCTPKYCPAWGTPFCTSHQKPKEQDGL